MFLLVVVSLAVSVCSAYKCCGPTTWEGKMGLQIGTMVNATEKHFTRGVLSMTFDGVNRIISQSQSIEIDGNPIEQRLVLDYNQGIGNIINANGNCYRIPLDRWISNCIPDNATSADFYFGIRGTGNNVEMQSKSYSIDFGSYQVYMAVTADTCVPMVEDVIGRIENKNVIERFVFVNVTAGITDRSVFSVPAHCSTAILGPRIPELGRRSIFR